MRRIHMPSRGKSRREMRLEAERTGGQFEEGNPPSSKRLKEKVTTIVIDRAEVHEAELTVSP